MTQLNYYAYGSSNMFQQWFKNLNKRIVHLNM